IDLHTLGAMLYHILELLECDAHVVIAVGIGGFNLDDILVLFDFGLVYRDKAVRVEANLAAQTAALSDCADVGHEVAAVVDLVEYLQLCCEHHSRIVEVFVEGNIAVLVEEWIGVEIKNGMAVDGCACDAIAQTFSITLS